VDFHGGHLKLAHGFSNVSCRDHVALIKPAPDLSIYHDRGAGRQKLILDGRTSLALISRDSFVS
jgi:hypothetical protein